MGSPISITKDCSSTRSPPGWIQNTCPPTLSAKQQKLHSIPRSRPNRSLRLRESADLEGVGYSVQYQRLPIRTSLALSPRISTTSPSLSQVTAQASWLDATPHSVHT